jgi:hypothetical protein
VLYYQNSVSQELHFIDWYPKCLFQNIPDEKPMIDGESKGVARGINKIKLFFFKGVKAPNVSIPLGYTL